jgi:hypothetical protein
MEADLIRAPKTSLTLYDFEDNLASLASTLELAEEAGAKEMIMEEIGQALRQAQEKRDAVVRFIRHCEAQQAFADQEIERIKYRRDRIAKLQTELEQYVILVIDRFVIPDRRGVKRLEGNFSSIRIQKNPDSVSITDEQALPPAWKDIAVTMPAYVWEGLLQRLSKEDRAFFEQKVKRTEFRPDKKAIGIELKTGVEIPGADLRSGDLRLVIS